MAGLLFMFVVIGIALFSLARVLLPMAWPVWSGVLAAAVGFITFGRSLARPETTNGKPEPGAEIGLAEVHEVIEGEATKAEEA